MLLKYRIAGLLSFVLLSVIGLFFHCTSEVAGTSVVGNPEVITAVIIDEKGTPQRDVPVALVPADYNAVLQKDSVSFIKGITDTAGLVVLRLGNDSAYNLTSTNQFYRYRLFKKIIVADSFKNSSNKTIDLGEVKLQDPGVIVVSIDSSSYRSGNYLLISGTLIKKEVTSPGIYDLKAPAGVVTVKYSALKSDTSKERKIDSVKVISNDSVKIATSKFLKKIIADTTILRDTLVIRDTFKLNEKLIKSDTLHLKDTVTILDSFLLIDTLLKIDTLTKKAKISHVFDTIAKSDTIRSVDTTFLGDTAFLFITTKKKIKHSYIIDTIKVIDTLWLLNTTTNFIKKGNFNKAYYIDTIQVAAVSLVNRMIRITKRVFDISKIITTSKIFDPYNTLPDTTIRIDTLTNTKMKEVFDSLNITDTLRNQDYNTDTATKYSDSLFVNDTIVSIDTLKSVRTSVFVNETVFHDTTITKDTVKSRITYPDSIQVPVTHNDFTFVLPFRSDDVTVFKTGVTENIVLSVPYINIKRVSGKVIALTKFAPNFFRFGAMLMEC